MKKTLMSFTLTLACIATCLIGTGCSNGVSEEDVKTAIQQEYEMLIGYDESVTNPLILSMREGFSVEEISIKDLEKNSTVNCVISNYNAKTALEEVLTEKSGVTMDNFESSLVETLKSIEKISEEMTLSVVLNEDGTCIVQFTEEQLDVAMGGLLSLYDGEGE